jgi:hypothetical protein
MSELANAGSLVTTPNIEAGAAPAAAKMAKIDAITLVRRRVVCIGILQTKVILLY